ncbi:peptidoglycan recognition family protein [Polymorphospora lycopeni]|uniref:Peptidoglycan recognition family protein n=1 Tax=Polymorphospora lycopeni TaxID=3140240 RepID=A0ABV5CJX2_9ACTN
MLSRRSLLAGATGLGATALVGMAGTGARAAEPAARPRRIPRTLARKRTGIASRTRTDAAEFTLTHLSVATTAAAAVRLRDRSGWGDWLPLDSCAAGHDDRSPTAVRRGLLVAPDVTGYEVQTSDGSPATVTELNTVDGPAGPVAAAATDRMPPETGRRGRGARGRRRDCLVPAYLSRAAWGADESLRFDAGGNELWVPAYYPVQTLTVHHTGVYEHNDDPDPAATVRAIYHTDTVSDGYGDVGYHLLVDEAGRVYEGRVSGADGLPVFGPDPSPDGRPQMSNGAHVGQFNAGNVGVALLGRFTARQPTPAARDSLVKVLALLSYVCELDAAGRTRYVNPVNNLAGVTDVISGHRDWAALGAGATECPGDAFHPALASVRRDVADLLGR